MRTEGTVVTPDWGKADTPPVGIDLLGRTSVVASVGLAEDGDQVVLKVLGNTNSSTPPWSMVSWLILREELESC